VLCEATSLTLLETPVEVLHQVWFELELVEGICLFVGLLPSKTGLTGFGTNIGLMFLISANLSIHPPLDNIKILSIGIRASNSDLSLTAWRKDVDKI
jgi:hypothetical protein